MRWRHRRCNPCPPLLALACSRPSVFQAMFVVQQPHQLFETGIGSMLGNDANQVLGFACNGVTLETVPMERRYLKKFIPRLAIVYSYVLVRYIQAPLGTNSRCRRIAVFPRACRYSQFELALIMVPRPDGTVAGKIEYNTDIFNTATMEVCAGLYEQI